MLAAPVVLVIYNVQGVLIEPWPTFDIFLKHPGNILTPFAIFCHDELS